MYHVVRESLLHFLIYKRGFPLITVNYILETNFVVFFVPKEIGGKGGHMQQKKNKGRKRMV